MCSTAHITITKWNMTFCQFVLPRVLFFPPFLYFVPKKMATLVIQNLVFAAVIRYWSWAVSSCNTYRDTSICCTVQRLISNTFVMSPGEMGALYIEWSQRFDIRRRLQHCNPVNPLLHALSFPLSLHLWLTYKHTASSNLGSCCAFISPNCSKGWYPGWRNCVETQDREVDECKRGSNRMKTRYNGW